MNFSSSFAQVEKKKKKHLHFAAQELEIKRRQFGATFETKQNLNLPDNVPSNPATAHIHLTVRFCFFNLTDQLSLRPSYVF